MAFCSSVRLPESPVFRHGEVQSLLADLVVIVRGDWARLNGDSEAGKSLRRDIRLRLKRAMFGDPELLESYRDYIDGLREMTGLYRAGFLNTPLAVRVAYIVRTSFYCTQDAEEYTSELQRLLGINLSPAALAA